MNKKRTIWLLIAALVVVGGYQKHKVDAVNEKKAAIAAEKLSKAFAAKTQADLDHMMHGLYLKSVCDFKDKLKPVTEMLQQISTRKSIPPDLIPEVKTFNDESMFMAMDEKIFLKRAEMNEEELKIESGLKTFSDELNLKTAELEGGMIQSSDKYFSSLEQKVNTLVSRACELHKAGYPEKYSTPTPTPTVTTSHAPGSIDSTIDKIGKQVSYDAICKLSHSSTTLTSDIRNAQSSKAFKNALLESSKTSVYDLGYAAFSFNGKGLYKPSPGEGQWAIEFESLKSKLEKSRYNYWATSSSSELSAMLGVASKMKALGNNGCAEVEKLKNS